jgi:hypothetical protein
MRVIRTELHRSGEPSSLFKVARPTSSACCWLQEPIQSAKTTRAPRPEKSRTVSTGPGFAMSSRDGAAGLAARHKRTRAVFLVGTVDLGAALIMQPDAVCGLP